MPHRAKLDHDRIYWGVEEVPELAEGDVPVPPDCDLRPGAYHWNPETRHFDPLPTEQVRKAPEAPTLEQAFYDFARQFPTDIEELPRLKAWCAWFEKSMDGRRG